MSQNLNVHFEDDSTRNSLELCSWHLTLSLENEASKLFEKSIFNLFGIDATSSQGHPR